MNFKIAVDSSGDLHCGMNCAPGVSLSIVPLTLHAGDLSYVDDAALDVHAALDALQASGAAVSTSCPSPEAWASVFREADCTFAITISSELSGSYRAAVIARDLVMDEFPDKKIASGRGLQPESAHLLHPVFVRQSGQGRQNAQADGHAGQEAGHAHHWHGRPGTHQSCAQVSW